MAHNNAVLQARRMHRAGNRDEFWHRMLARVVCAVTK